MLVHTPVHGANMGPTWVLSAPDGPHVGPMSLVIRVSETMFTATHIPGLLSSVNLAIGQLPAHSNYIPKLQHAHTSNHPWAFNLRKISHVWLKLALPIWPNSNCFTDLYSRLVLVMCVVWNMIWFLPGIKAYVCVTTFSKPSAIQDPRFPGTS